jgi:hypothetical protein
VIGQRVEFLVHRQPRFPVELQNLRDWLAH